MESIEKYVEKQDHFFQERHAKIKNRNRVEAYPYSYSIDTSVEDIKTKYKDLESGQNLEDSVTIAGRIMGKRVHGKSTFLDIQQEGNRLQLFVSEKNMGHELYEEIIESSDLGDLYGIKGNIMTTKTGELSVRVSDATLLAKCLRQLPDKHSGLKDVGVIKKQPHLNYIQDSTAMQVIRDSATIKNSLRDTLNSLKFLEVNTPILQPIYGGANARPFVTHLNALDQKMYLRISNEIYLKRLIISGFDRVFEFSQDFRNEGIDASHNPEFIQLEAYQAHTDYEGIMKLVETLVENAAQSIHESSKFNYQGQVINVEAPWEKMTMEKAVERSTGLKWSNLTNQQLKNELKKREINLPEFTRGYALNALFEKFGESLLVQPTIIYDYPIEVSPLAKKHREKEGLTERFEYFIINREFGNAFSELNDPIDQRQRFLDQEKARSWSDETHPIDEDFLAAMEYGMPPTGGMGLGLERLIALLTNQTSIRNVMTFPLTKL